MIALLPVISALALQCVPFLCPVYVCAPFYTRTHTGMLRKQPVDHPKNIRNHADMCYTLSAPKHAAQQGRFDLSAHNGKRDLLPSLAAGTCICVCVCFCAQYVSVCIKTDIFTIFHVGIHVQV